jgi:hypothetical protein
MDSRKKQYEKSFPLAESGAAIASPSVIGTSLATESGLYAARIVATKGTLAAMQETPKDTEKKEMLGEVPILKKTAQQKKTGSLLPMASLVNGMRQNSQSKAEDAQFAGQQNQIIAVISCTSTIGIAAAKSALAAVNAFAAYCVCAVTLLLSAWNPIEIGQKGLSPILRGINE